jgi:hypothetical protein
LPTKPANPPLLGGQAARDASHPLSQSARGGANETFDGSTAGKPIAAPNPVAGGQPNIAQPDQDFTGMGPWLEADDKTVFTTANDLVLRQELLAINQLHPDKHYTLVKRGFPFSTLTKDPNKDTYRQEIPTGMTVQVQAVPNQSWDLVNKATEAILVDPPQPDPSPLNDSEEAQQAAEGAERFLTEDAGENGTGDIEVFYAAVDKALVCASSYIEGWVDPVGGGYVPLQIEAHPQAESPDNPLIGPDGNPTPNLVLRYVTAPTGGEFTGDPAKAAPQWIPKIIETVWFNEHIRVFPESVPVEKAQLVIGLFHCTIAQAKKRWPIVEAMKQEELNDLLNWQPPRYPVLLPPFQRNRFKLSSGSDAKSGGASDERILFYYQIYDKAEPDHKRGADVAVSGSNGGKILFKDTLSILVKGSGNPGQTEAPPDPAQSQPGQAPQQPALEDAKPEVRCMDIPIVQVTPRADPDEKNPRGVCYMELFVGGTEFNASLLTGFLEALGLWLHPERYSFGTSPVQGFQIDESRVSGNAIPIFKVEDKPQIGIQPAIPTNFFDAYDRNDQNIRSIASLTKPVTGQDTSQEVSGKARQIAVQQGMVGLSRMQNPINAAHERYYRIKLQLFQRKFTTAHMVRYVGEDGSHKVDALKAEDFALVGNVGIQSGTGTMLPPDQKVNYIGTLVANQMLDPVEGADAARQTFAQRLGLPASPHKQYIERCIALWLKGPPEGWVQAWQEYQPQKQAYDAQQQQVQAGQQQQIIAQQQAQVQAPVDAANQQAQQVKQADQQHAVQMEQQKAQTTLQLEQAKHQMVMEQKQADAQIAASAPQPQAPQPPPEIIVQPPDLTPIADAMNEMRNLVAAVLSKEPVAQTPQAPPVVNVHPQVHVPAQAAPVVHVPQQAAPVVHNHPPAQAAAAPKKKRRGKLTPQKDGSFTMESGEED